MRLRQKLNLERFKKSLQGYIEFATLIEQAEHGHAEKLIQQTREQDAEFVFKVMRKVVFFEEIIYLDEAILAEILSKTSPKVLAFALMQSDPEFRTHVLRHLGYREMKAVVEEEDKVANVASKSLILGAQRQILKIGRELEAQNKFIFESLDCPRLRHKKKA